MPRPKHIFVDANISPDIARWIAHEYDIQVTHVEDLAMESADDVDIFRAAQTEGGVILSKDRDFVPLVKRLPPPPALIWLRCLNRPDPFLRALFRQQMPRALSLLRMGECVVEIADNTRKTKRKP